MIILKSRLFDVFIREPKLIWKYYRPFLWSERKKTNRYIFMADGKFLHGGMFDRLKGIISIYALAKAQGKDFKINFIHPFSLEDYLVPNTYNWTIDSYGPVIYQYPTSRPIFGYGECYEPSRILKDRKGEIHFYYGYNSLKEINEKYGTSFDWGELYNELFKPSPHLQKYINYYKNEVGSEYIAIHTRFLNLLGDKTETTINPVLPEDKQNDLKKKISKCIGQIIKHHHGCRVMIASDSPNFIAYIQQIFTDVYIVPGEISHIGTHNSNDAQNIKMFVDYYLMGGAKKIYSLWSEGMWKSAFPEYAAKIGRTDFERIDTL
jgi:hypothetical protein